MNTLWAFVQYRYQPKKLLARLDETVQQADQASRFKGADWASMVWGFASLGAAVTPAAAAAISQHSIGLVQSMNSSELCNLSWLALTPLLLIALMQRGQGCCRSSMRLCTCIAWSAGMRVTLSLARLLQSRASQYPATPAGGWELWICATSPSLKQLLRQPCRGTLTGVLNPGCCASFFRYL